MTIFANKNSQIVINLENERLYNYLDQHLYELQAEGKRSFSLPSLKKKFSDYSLNALQMNLKRLNKKKKIKHIMKGFYVIISPEYSYQKILPLELFIDALFKYLERPYYVGLLSAAVYHGATHQQVQEFFVFINKPALRPIKVEGLKINYVVKSQMPSIGLEKRKTQAGYLNVSSPELTALDLAEFEHRVGGLNRVTTVLYELSESMVPGKLNDILQNKISNSVLQRLGYLLDRVLEKKNLSDVIKNYLSDKKIYRVPLKSDEPKTGFPVHEVWKIIENFEVETDF